MELTTYATRKCAIPGSQAKGEISAMSGEQAIEGVLSGSPRLYGLGLIVLSQSRSVPRSKGCLLTLWIATSR